MCMHYRHYVLHNSLKVHPGEKKGIFFRSTCIKFQVKPLVYSIVVINYIEKDILFAH